MGRSGHSEFPSGEAKLQKAIQRHKLTEPAHTPNGGPSRFVGNGAIAGNPDHACRGHRREWPDAPVEGERCNGAPLLELNAIARLNEYGTWIPDESHVAISRFAINDTLQRRLRKVAAAGLYG